MNRRKQKQAIISFIILWSSGCLAQAIHSNTSSWKKDYHYLAGELQSLKGHHQNSISHFKQTLNEGNHHFHIQWRLAKEYALHGWLNQAEKECQQITANHRTFEPALLLLGEIYHSLGLKKTALHYYQKVLKINPTQHQALLAQALLFIEIQHPLSNQMAKPFLSNPLFHQKKGDIHWLRGETTKAIHSLKTAFQLDSSNRRSAWKLFHIYNQQNTPQLFIELLKDIPQDDPYMISLLARSYLRKGDKEKAMEKLENLLLDDPSIWNLKAELVIGI